MKSVVSITFLIILAGCIPDNYNFKYDIVILDIPANLEGINTVYDDYNSDLPYPAGRQKLYFSSNRNSNGNNFDIVFKAIDISYHEKDDILNFDLGTNAYSSFEDKGFPLINTEYDELGPYTYEGIMDTVYDYFFYSNNSEGNFDIKFIYTPRGDWGHWDAQERLFGPYSAGSINSDADDLYPTIDMNEYEMYFCSNRESEVFDIYSVDLLTNNYLFDFMISSQILDIRKNETLSGNANDKCPSIRNNIIVFASDREGGYGGYDLYYSLCNEGEWSEPVNFGSKINSEYNEYRPITFTFLDSCLMIFSCDNPDGKGGFDLYCVKINEIGS